MPRGRRDSIDLDANRLTLLDEHLGDVTNQRLGNDGDDPLFFAFTESDQGPLLVVRRKKAWTPGKFKAALKKQKLSASDSIYIGQLFSPGGEDVVEIDGRSSKGTVKEKVLKTNLRNLATEVGNAPLQAFAKGAEYRFASHSGASKLKAKKVHKSKSIFKAGRFEHVRSGMKALDEAVGPLDRVNAASHLLAQVEGWEEDASGRKLSSRDRAKWAAARDARLAVMEETVLFLEDGFGTLNPDFAAKVMETTDLTMGSVASDLLGLFDALDETPMDELQGAVDELVDLAARAIESVQALTRLTGTQPNPATMEELLSALAAVPSELATPSLAKTMGRLATSLMNEDPLRYNDTVGELDGGPLDQVVGRLEDLIDSDDEELAVTAEYWRGVIDIAEFDMQRLQDFQDRVDMEDFGLFGGAGASGSYLLREGGEPSVLFKASHQEVLGSTSDFRHGGNAMRELLAQDVSRVLPFALELPSASFGMVSSASFHEDHPGYKPKDYKEHGERWLLERQGGVAIDWVQDSELADSRKEYSHPDYPGVVVTGDDALAAGGGTMALLDALRAEWGEVERGGQMVPATGLNIDDFRVAIGFDVMKVTSTFAVPEEHQERMAGQLKQLALWDMMTLQGDRNPADLLISEGPDGPTLHPLDHGEIFPSLRTTFDRLSPSVMDVSRFKHPWAPWDEMGTVGTLDDDDVEFFRRLDPDDWGLDVERMGRARSDASGGVLPPLSDDSVLLARLMARALKDIVAAGVRDPRLMSSLLVAPRDLMDETSDLEGMPRVLAELTDRLLPPRRELEKKEAEPSYLEEPTPELFDDLYEAFFLPWLDDRIDELVEEGLMDAV